MSDRDLYTSHPETCPSSRRPHHVIGEGSDVLVDHFLGHRIEIHQSRTRAPWRYYAILDGEVLKTAAGRRRSWKTQDAALREARRSVSL